MFGLGWDELSAIFDKLPVALQVAIAIGVAFGGAFVVIKQLMKKVEDTNGYVHPLSIELAKQAAEIADAKLRDDLKTVVESTRIALENRIEKLADEIRAMITADQTQAKQDRHTLYDRLQTLATGFDRDFGELEKRVRAMEQQDG